jgi:hypothetical protein
MVLLPFELAAEALALVCEECTPARLAGRFPLLEEDEEAILEAETVL